MILEFLKNFTFFDESEPGSVILLSTLPRGARVGSVGGGAGTKRGEGAGNNRPEGAGTRGGAGVGSNRGLGAVGQNDWKFGVAISVDVSG